MNEPSITEEFTRLMKPRIEAFAAEVGGLNTSGIAEPHLPHWGVLYETASPKIGFIGQDTRGWGEMESFIEAIKKEPASGIYRGKEEFDSFEFTNWTNNFGKTFWDTTLKLIAGAHGVDWKSLKRQEIAEPIQSFFWANTNSVERFESGPKSNGVEWDRWRKIKEASETHLDSFRMILDVLQPEIVVLMDWDASNHFIDFDLDWKELGNHLAEAFDPQTGCHILLTAHPLWLNREGIYDEIMNEIIKRLANRSIKETNKTD